MESDTLMWIGSLVAIILLIFAFAYLVYLLFRTSYLLPERDQAYVRTGFGGEKIAHGTGIFIFPGMHKKLLLDMKTHRITVERREEHACTTKNRLRIDIAADFLVRITPTDEKISLAGQTLGKAASDSKLLIDQINGTCIEALRDATAKMSFEDLHDDNQQFNDRIEDAIAEDLSQWGLQLEGISIAKLTQTDLKYFDRNNALDVEGLTIIKAKIAENEKKQASNEAERIKEVAEHKLSSDLKILKIKEEQVQAEQAQDLAIAQTQLETERKIEQARASEQIAIAEANLKVSEAWITAHEMKAKEVAKEEEIQTSLLTTKAHRNKKVRIIDADLHASRTRILAEAEKDADVLRAHAVSARYTVDAEGKKALNKAANILSDKQISMQVKEKIVSQLPDIIKESVKPIKNIDGIKIMQIDGMSHIAGGAGGSGNNNGSGGNNNGGGGFGGGSLSDQIVDSALRYKAQAPMVDNLLEHVGLSGAGIKDFTTGLQKDMDLDTPASTKKKSRGKNKEESKGNKSSKSKEDASETVDDVSKESSIDEAENNAPKESSGLSNVTSTEDDIRSLNDEKKAGNS